MPVTCWHCPGGYECHGEQEQVWVPKLEGLPVLQEALTASEKQYIKRATDYSPGLKDCSKASVRKLKPKSRAVWVFPKQSPETALFLESRAPAHRISYLVPTALCPVHPTPSSPSQLWPNPLVAF